MYILYDCETGGLTKAHSILTLYIAALDKDLNITSEINLKIKPDDGRYVVTEDALKVNGIILEEHDKVAVKESLAKSQVSDFIQSNFQSNGGVPLIAIGQNIIAFDNKMIVGRLIDDSQWKSQVDQENICDTLVMIKDMRAKKILPEHLPGKLETVAEYFFIKTYGLHDAKNDCEVTLKVYKKLKELEDRKTKV